jgi:alpha-L-rhamnosidase
MALRFDLPPDGQTESVAKSLAREVTDKHKGHAMVGIHGGRPLFTQLAEHGYDELAITALKQDQWPGHAYTINQGFTTWPEIANEVKAGERIFHSLNHPMHSGFAAWFHESVAGIRPAAPGFKQIHLKPHGFRQLEQAQAWHDSPYGRIESAWQCRHGAFEWAIRVPPNTTATAWLPAASADSASEGGKPLSRAEGVRILRQEGDRVVLALESGNYQFKSNLTGQ